MISVIVYLMSVLLDVATTDRALRRHQSITESHPVICKLFGPRPSRGQFFGYASAQTILFIAAAYTIPGADPTMLLVVAAGHLWAAVSNYRLERDTRNKDA